MLSRVYVVADPPEAERVALWLRDDLDVDVRVGDGSDDTLHDLLSDPVHVVVLSAGLARGDALAFAGALRGGHGGGDPSLVLVADEHGAVRNALDALPFGADRFLRRPLSRSALVFAVRSCLNLGRPGVAGNVDAMASVAAAPAVTVAMKVLAEIAPAPAGAATISSGVALHTIASRIDQATSEAIEAFLADAVDSVLSNPPEAPFSDEDLDADRGTTHAPAAPPVPAARWRDATVVLTGGSSPPPAAPEAQRTGTFVSALRQHMSAVEARLFGEPDGEPPPPEDPTGEIDLDAIGVTTVSPLADEEAPSDDTMAAGGAGTIAAPPLDLAHEDPASLLGRLAREGITARVNFQRADALKTVWLEEGRPVFAASASAADRMGEMLVREGKISREQHQRAREGLVASGRRIGEILVEQGALKRRELYPAVRRHVEELLYALFAWDGGSAQITAGAGARDEKIRLAAPAAALICEGIRRKMELGRLRELVGPPHTVLAPRKPHDLLAALAEADLGPEERQLVAGLDGRRTLAELADDAGGAELTVYQVAHLCAALGLLAPPGDGGTDVDRTTGVAAGTGGSGDAGIDRERVLSKYAQVLEGDYFELLGVRRDASGHEVRRAFEAARRDFAPESFAVEVQRELGAELAAIGEVLGEAQRVLRDDELRASYREHLIDGD